MPLKIVRENIAKMKTEAIVNTASEFVAVGAGCDADIYAAAGHRRLLAYRRKKIGTVPEGEVFITPGFRLHAKYIIHAVSPLYLDGEHGEEEKLRACYQKSLALAKEHEIHSIAFPLIATGSFAYPKEEGLRIAIDEINRFLLESEMVIYLAVYDEEATKLGKKIYPELEDRIHRNTVPVPGLAGASFGRSARVAGRSVFPTQDSARESAPDACMPNVFMAKEVTLASYEDIESSECFEIQHEKKLDERMQHLSDTFSQYLLYLIQEKKLSNSDVWKRGIVDKKVFSKMKNNSNYHPQKMTALCLCVGAMLNLDETKDLLARAGYALSPCDKTDIIFSYFIENEIYDMIELDIQLEEHGLPCVIS